MNLLNRVKVQTGTTGTGTITLGGAEPGYQTFAAAGAVNSASYTYVITDGINWEVGFGVYTTTGTTLTRNLIESSTGSLLNLSGFAKVLVTPNNRSLLPNIGLVRTPMSVINPLGTGDGGGTNDPLANTVRLLPFVMERGRTLDQLYIRCSATVVASSNCRIGIYACPGNKGLPVGSPIIATGNLATDVANADLTSTSLNTFLPAGLYYMAVFTSAATNFVRLSGTGRDLLLSQIPAFTTYAPFAYAAVCHRITATFPTWPVLTGVIGDFTATNDDTNSMPYVGMGVTS